MGSTAATGNIHDRSYQSGSHPCNIAAGNSTRMGSLLRRGRGWCSPCSTMNTASAHWDPGRVSDVEGRLYPDSGQTRWGGDDGRDRGPGLGLAPDVRVGERPIAPAPPPPSGGGPCTEDPNQTFPLQLHCNRRENSLRSLRHHGFSGRMTVPTGAGGGGGGVVVWCSSKSAHMGCVTREPRALQMRGSAPSLALPLPPVYKGGVRTLTTNWGSEVLAFVYLSIPVEHSFHRGRQGEKWESAPLSTPGSVVVRQPRVFVVNLCKSSRLRPAKKIDGVLRLLRCAHTAQHHHAGQYIFTQNKIEMKQISGCPVASSVLRHTMGRHLKGNGRRLEGN